jgi:hypothetical protein
MEEADLTQPEATRDSEQQALPLQEPAIEGTSIQDSGAIDIKEIIRSCLEDAKRQNNTRFAIKSLFQLIAVSEYVDLRARYKKTKACKRPCLSASISIARRMGKGPYIARQIRHNERYLLRNRQLPPPKTLTRYVQYNPAYASLDNLNATFRKEKDLQISNTSLIGGMASQAI